MASRCHSKKAGGSKGPGLSTTNNPAHIQPEFIVEEITGKRYVNGRVEMQLKWKDLPPENSSWEPLENLGKCIRLVADFEATLFSTQEMASRGSKKKVGKEPTAMKASPAPAAGERQLSACNPTGPKTIDKPTPKSSPHPNTGLEIGGNQKEEKPIKLHSPLHLQWSDDEFPSISLGQWANPTPSDWEISPCPLSSASSSESFISSGSNSQLLNELRTLDTTKTANSLSSPKEPDHHAQAEENITKSGALVNTQKKTKKMQKNPIPATTENPIDKILIDLRNMQVIEKGPKVNTSVQGPKESKKSTKKIQEQESSDEDPDSPVMTPCETVFGLARGLELDEVVHSFNVFDRHFLFVTWKGIEGMDTVPMEELKEAYPAQVLQYFEKMERRYD